MAATVSRDELLDAVRRMKPAEFDSFLERAFCIRTKQSGAALSRRETELLLKINAGPPEELRRRYAELRARRAALSKADRTELLRLTDEMELHDARRAEAMLALAKLRGVPVRKLMDQLGIKAQPIRG